MIKDRDINKHFMLKDKVQNLKSMLEHIADFTAWPILTGIFIRYIAHRIMSGEGKGCCMTLFIGIVGSYAGAIISSLLNIELFGKGGVTDRSCGVSGAMAGLWMWKELVD